jgi:hypothetical protein
MKTQLQLAALALPAAFFILPAFAATTIDLVT